MINYEELYNTSKSFQLYVDKNCKTYGWTKEKAFKDKIIQSYAEYVLKDQPKEVEYEIKQNHGCC